MVLRWLWLFAALLAAQCTEPPARYGSAPRPEPNHGRPGRHRDAPPPPAREFRAAWVATVANIDWPSRPGLPTALARAELDAIVARAAELKLNALVFQVRPAADALYRSVYEPWSEWLTGAQGRPPDEDWDPLAYVIDRCHERGLELHAWFNPFRAGHPSGRSPAASNHVRTELPESCLRFGEYVWMDPGHPDARRRTLAVILDVVDRYDVDGVHIDDYFYPYPQRGRTFDDRRTYAAYRSSGGRLGKDDWRRKNIDTFVELLYTSVKAHKVWVQVGISPFGIARPGVPRGIVAGVDQYAELYADVPKWLREGWLDYLAPQLYWPIDQKPQSFPLLLAYWHRENTLFRHVWPGINPGRCLLQKPPCRPDELSDQLALIRGHDRSQGHVHFSFKALKTDAPNVGGALRYELYPELAVAPASPWLGTSAPRAPLARLTPRADGVTLTWQTDPQARFAVVQVADGDGWRTARVIGAKVGRCELPSGYQRIAVSVIGRTGVQSPVVQL